MLDSKLIDKNYEIIWPKIVRRSMCRLTILTERTGYSRYVHITYKLEGIGIKYIAKNGKRIWPILFNVNLHAYPAQVPPSSRILFYTIWPSTG